MNESPLVSRKRAADISATRVLPLVLLSMPILSACGGGGSSTVSDTSQTDQQAQNEEQDQVSDISGDETEVVVTNSAPTISPLPDEIEVGSSEIGKIYIDDEVPGTVQLEVVSTSNNSLVISSDNELSLTNTNGISVGDTIEFILTATDEEGLVTEVSYAVDVVAVDEDEFEFDLSYEIINGDEVKIEINVPLAGAGGDGEVEGMQFDLQFDPAVFTYTPGDFERKGFAIEAINANMADQGLLRIAVAALDAQEISGNSLVDITLNLQAETINSTLVFTAIQVDDLQFGQTDLSIIA